MGRRHYVKPFKILDNIDISTDQESDWTDVSQKDKVNYSIEWDGDAEGELKVVVATEKDGATEHELDFGEQIIIGASEPDKQHQILINTIAHKYMKLKFVSTSGTGNLTAEMSMTSEGA